jgi:hypothetical protein
MSEPVLALLRVRHLRARVVRFTGQLALCVHGYPLCIQIPALRYIHIAAPRVLREWLLQDREESLKTSRV